MRSDRKGQCEFTQRLFFFYMQLHPFFVSWISLTHTHTHTHTLSLSLSLPLIAKVAVSCISRAIVLHPHVDSILALSGAIRDQLRIRTLLQSLLRLMCLMNALEPWTPRSTITQGGVQIFCYVALVPFGTVILACTNSWRL